MSLYGAFRIEEGANEKTEKVLWLKTRHTFSDVVESVKGRRGEGKTHCRNDVRCMLKIKQFSSYFLF